MKILATIALVLAAHVLPAQKTLDFRLTTQGANHVVEVKADTSAYLVGGNLYLKTQPGVQFTYDFKENSDYSTGSVFWPNDPFLDTIATLNFWSAYALLGGKPYEELNIVKLDTVYKHLVTIYSGSSIRFRHNYTMIINPFVYSSEPGNFGGFSNFTFSYDYITGLDGNEVRLPVTKRYFTLDWKELKPPFKTGMYIVQEGYDYKKMIVYGL